MNPLPPAAPLASPIEWWWWALVGASVALGLGIVLWALLWDRSRGRKRCPKCWYDMAGVEPRSHSQSQNERSSDQATERADQSQWRCPECGLLITRGRKLHKTRRRWRWALAALALLVLAPPTALVIQARRIGFWQAMPDWALIWIVDWRGWPEPSWLPPTGGLWRANLTAAPDPASDELFQRLTNDTLSDHAVDRIFRASVESIIQTRDQWPANLPIHAEVRLNPWILVVDRSELELQDVGGLNYSIGIGPIGRSWYRGSLFDRSLHPIEQGASGIRFRAILNTEDALLPTRFAGRRFEHEFLHEIEVVESIHDILTPISEAALTTWMRESLRFRLVRLLHGNPQILVWFGNEVLQGGVELLPSIDLGEDLDLFNDLSLGLRFELIRDGEVIDEVRTWADFSEIAAGHQVWISNPATAWRAGGFTLGEWTLRVIGDGEMALRDFKKTKYWAGEFEIPMSGVEIKRTVR